MNKFIFKSFFVLFIFSSFLYGDCSSYKGSVTLNEVYKPGTLSSDDPFIELSTVDGTDINSSWTVTLKTNDGTYTYNPPVDSCDGDDDYKQITLNDADEIDLENGMSITLTDADGNYIDYLVMDGNDVEGHHDDCSYDYGTEVDTSDISFYEDADTYRDPDTKGDWVSENQRALMTSNDSTCDSNDGSSKIYVDPNGDSSNDGSSCDKAKYTTINDALDSIRGTTDGPYTIKVCTGDYDEALDLNDSAFDGLTIRGDGRNVNLKNNADAIVSINSNSINKISFYNINFNHDTTCNDCSGNDGKFLFDFKKNANSASAQINIGNIPTITGGSCPTFNFSSSNFAGNFNFFGFGNFKSSCDAVELSECDTDKESFDFKSMIFKIQSSKDDKFGFYFGDNVSKDCNISLESITLDMNQSSGIRFKERGDFSFDGFDFKNASDDVNKSALIIEKLSGTQYHFSHFNIDTSGVPFDFSNLNTDINLTMSTGRMVSRLNNGLKLTTIKTATFDNVRILAHSQGMDLNVSGDLNITDSRLKSDGCGFLFRYGNPQFTSFHISAGDCDYSFKKTEGGVTDTAFIHDSSFGLKKSGTGTYPLDWGADKTFDLNNSCFCPKQKKDFGAIYRPYEDDNSKKFQADGNFWKYLPKGNTYDSEGFKDDAPLEDCPFEEFIDACSKVGGFSVYKKQQRDDDNISNSVMPDQKINDVFADINISSIDTTDETQVIDFNGTVCARVIDNNGDSKMGWIKVFIDEGNTTNIDEFNSTFETKNAKVNFRWARNTAIADTDCDDKLNTSEADSPQEFKIVGDKNTTFVAYTKYDDGNISDSNFTTQKIGQKIFFRVASVDSEDSSKVEDFNGTVCLRVVDLDDNNNSMTDWKLLDDFKSEVNTTDVNVTVEDNVTRRASIEFEWAKDEEKDCTDVFDENHTSVDDYQPRQFAVIPDKFVIDINETSMKAGEDYTLEINATEENGSVVTTYTQTFSDNDKNVTLWFNSKQNGEEYNRSYTFKIVDGNGSRDDFNITDVGVYTVRIIDKNFAVVDENDTAEENRTIFGEKNITVTPYLFELNVDKNETSTGKNWAYMNQGDFSDMNYTITGTVTAYNKQHEVTKHFDKNESAYDITTKVDFDSNLSSEDSDMLNVYDATKFDVSTNEFNTTAQTFENGVSHISFVYKIDKNVTDEHMPVYTELKDLAITDTQGADTNIIQQIDDNVSWYYSRIKGHDIATKKDTAQDYFYIEVYKANVGVQTSLNWYTNEKDNVTPFNDSDFKTYKTRVMNDTTDQNITDTNVTKGKVSFNINKNDDTSAFIHINIPKYLWFDYGLNTDYDYSDGSDCSSHPCVKYKYFDSNGANVISTGDYKGGDINTSNESKNTQVGIKVYR